MGTETTTDRNTKKKKNREMSILTTHISRKDREGESRLLVDTSNLTGSGFKLDCYALNGVTIHYLCRKARYYMSIHTLCTHRKTNQSVLSLQLSATASKTVRGVEKIN